MYESSPFSQMNSADLYYEQHFCKIMRERVAVRSDKTVYSDVPYDEHVDGLGQT